MPVPILSLYARSDELVTIGASVTADHQHTQYQPSWVADGIPNRPFRSTEDVDTLRLTFTEGAISGIAVCNHNITPGSVLTIADVPTTGTVTAPAVRPNGINYNVWIPVSPETVSSTLEVSATSEEALIIGEIFAGRMREFPGGGFLINNVTGTNQRRGAAPSALSVRPYDLGEAARRWSSTVLATPAELEDMMAWFESQRNGSLPSLFVPDADVNDVWVVELLEPAWTLEPNSQDLFYVTITMQEYPRVRW